MAAAANGWHRKLAIVLRCTGLRVQQAMELRCEDVDRVRKLMLVRPEGPDGKPTGTGYLAVDQIAAGPGDRVLVLSEGSGVRQLLGGNPPIRSVIVGIVDDVYREI